MRPPGTVEKSNSQDVLNKYARQFSKDIDLAVFGLPSSLIHKGADLALTILPGGLKNDRIAWNRRRIKGCSRSSEKYVPVKDDCVARWELSEKRRTLFSHTHTHTPHHDSLTDCLPLVQRGLPAMCFAAAAGQRRPAAVGLPPLAPGRLALAGDVLPPAPAPCLMCYRFKIHSLLTRSVCPTSPSHNQRAQCYWTP
jgi:hypothetical protein